MWILLTWDTVILYSAKVGCGLQDIPFVWLGGGARDYSESERVVIVQYFYKGISSDGLLLCDEAVS